MKHGLTVKEFVDAKLHMEQRIAVEIAKAIGQFTAHTGSTPTTIDVSMIEVERIGQPLEYVVGEVKAGVSLS